MNPGGQEGTASLPLAGMFRGFSFGFERHYIRGRAAVVGQFEIALRSGGGSSYQHCPWSFIRSVTVIRPLTAHRSTASINAGG